MPTCDTAECCSRDLYLGDFYGFSLVGGDYPGGVILGNPESSFIVECPEGISCEAGTYPVPYTYPENSTVTYPPPGDGGPIILRVPCPPGNDIVRELPSDSTQAEINAALNQMFRQCGQATADRVVNTATIAETFTSQAIDPVMCDGLLFSAAPGGLLQFNDATKIASLPSGTHVNYTSQESVDAEAAAYVATVIQTFKDNGGQCGYWNTEQTVVCQDDTEQTTPAFTYFSAVSQAAADQLAADAAEALCPQGCTAAFDSLVWSVSSDSGPNPGTWDADGPFATATKPGNGTINVQAFQTPITPGTNCSARIYGNIQSAGQVRLILGGSTVFSRAVIGAFDSTIAVVMVGGTATMVLSVTTPLGFTNNASVFFGPP